MTDRDIQSLLAFEKANTAVDRIRECLPVLTDDMRRELFRAVSKGYCQNCGSVEKGPRPCQCNNDE